MTYDPWADAENRPWLALRRQNIDAEVPSVYARRGERAMIFLRDDLDPPVARCALTEELLHDEATQFPILEQLRTTQEQRIQERAANRLVTDAELRAAWCFFGAVETTTLAEVAEWLGVTEAVLERRLKRWRHPTNRRQT